MNEMIFWGLVFVMISAPAISILVVAWSDWHIVHGAIDIAKVEKRMHELKEENIKMRRELEATWPEWKPKGRDDE